MPRKLTLICSLMLVLLSLPMQAQEKSNLRAELEPVKARNGGPVTLFWKFRWDGTSLLEGHLEMDLRFYGNQRLGTFRTHDMVLTTGEQSFTIMLPPVRYEGIGSDVPDLHVRFVGKNGTIKLGQWPVAIASSHERKFVMCICDLWERSQSPEEFKFVNSLDFTKYDPAMLEQRSRQQATAAPVYVAPENMPAGIMNYCSFDLVILTEDGFAELDEKKLQVIGNWVEAGGRLCLLPGKGTHKPFHATFLNNLVSKGKDETPFVLNTKGKLVYEQPLPGPAWMVHKGLGRVGIVSKSQTDQELKSSQWRQFVAFMWHVRTDQMSSIRTNGTWTAYGGGNYNYRNNQYRLSPSSAPLPSASGILNGLMPDDVEVVPLPLIGFLLFLYVLAIGPIDYFLLGFFKQRKLTWIVFPVVTIGFTLFTVWLSHAYMSADDNRKAITFHDLGDNGKIVRTSRFELLFNSRRKTVRNKVSRALFTAMDHQRFGNLGYPNYPQQNIESLTGATNYEGRIPTQYVAVQEIPQWTPQLNRRFSLTVTKPKIKFDWDGAGDLQPRSGELKRRILDAFGPEATAFIYRGAQGQTPVSGSTSLFKHTTQYSMDGTTGITFLHDLCVRPPNGGLFQVVSRVAPTGGSNFEDLAILDPSNQNEWLLVVIVRNGDDVDVYRKLFTGGI